MQFSLCFGNGRDDCGDRRIGNLAKEFGHRLLLRPSLLDRRHDIFTAQGVTNVTWVWSPNIDFSNSVPLRELYPGDSYVDWVAMDGYNWGNIGAWHTWDSFSTLFQQTYDEMLAITSKPMMIGEMASTEQDGNKAAWISDAYTTPVSYTHLTLPTKRIV